MDSNQQLQDKGEESKRHSNSNSSYLRQIILRYGIIERLRAKDLAFNCEQSRQELQWQSSVKGDKAKGKTSEGGYPKVAKILSDVWVHEEELPSCTEGTFSFVVS